MPPAPTTSLTAATRDTPSRAVRVTLLVAVTLAGFTGAALAPDGAPRWAILGALVLGLNVLVIGMAVRGGRLRRTLLERSLELNRRAAQLELQQGLASSEHQFRVIFEHAPEGVLLTDEEGAIASANPAAHRLFGYGDGALVGARISSIIGSEPVVADLFTDGGEDGVPILRPGMRRDGGRFVVGMTSRSLSDGGRTQTVAMVRDVTAFINRLRAVEHDRQAALERERGRAELLATMSHEVRTPLGGVVGMVQVLAEEPLPDEQRELVRHIQRSSRALVDVLDDLLSASSLRSEEVAFKEVPFDVLELVEEVVVLHHDAADRKRLELAVGAAGELRRELLGDPHRIRQVIGNLVGNAIKYTHAGHVRVDVATRELGDGIVELRVVVKDTGVGIPSHRLDDIFERYARVSDANAPAVAGTGLGLAIAREIARRMGGDVTARSTRGDGSELTFVARLQGGREVVPVRVMAGVRALVALRSRVARELVVELLSSHGARCVAVSGPAHLAEELAASRARAQPFSVALVDTDILVSAPTVSFGRVALVASYPLGDRRAALVAGEHGAIGALRRPLLPSRALEVLAAAASGELPSPPLTSRVVRPSRPTDDAPPYAGCRILVAEDNPTNQRVAVVMIGKLGCEVDVATDGREALRMTRDKRYDLVFMDCQMPEIDGYDATREIRTWGGEYAELPIIALTASTSDRDRSRSLDAGMSDHLTKPVTRDSFERTLNRWLLRGAVRRRRTASGHAIDVSR